MVKRYDSICDSGMSSEYNGDYVDYGTYLRLAVVVRNLVHARRAFDESPEVDREILFALYDSVARDAKALLPIMEEDGLYDWRDAVDSLGDDMEAALSLRSDPEQEGGE